MSRGRFAPLREGGRNAPWGRVLAWVPPVVVGLVAVWFIFSCFYTVAAYERAVVLRLGGFEGVSEPGLHFKIPLVDRVLKVSTEEHSLRLPFGASAQRPGEQGNEATLMLTGDLNTAAVEWTVQWKVTVPEDYLLNLPQRDDDASQGADPLIVTVARSVMNRLIGDYSIDEVLTDQRSAIADLARQDTQRILHEYGCGITITDLQMQRVTPPESVKPSFDRVVASLQRRDQLENEAAKERNQKLPAAYAEKDKLIQAAEGYAQAQLAEARGETAALLARYRAYEKAPQVTRQRLYLEAMQEVLQQVESKLIVDAAVDQFFPLLTMPDTSGAP